MASPVLRKGEQFQPRQTITLGLGYPPSTQPEGVFTVENALTKTLAMFGLLFVTAAVGWFVPVLAFPAAIAALVLGLVLSFKKEPSAALTIAFSAVEGLMVGGLSSILEQVYPGVVVQAVIATFVVVGVTLALFTSGKVRATPKMTKFFMIAATSYLLFSLINLGLMLTGVNDDPWGLRGSVVIFGIPLGILLGVFAVLMGAYSLIIDFTFIENGAQNRIPEKFGWIAAFGIISSVVWIYVEILRMFALSRR